MNFQKEISAYLHYCEYQKKLSSKSIKAYNIDLRQFMEYLIATQGRCITKTAISEYIQKLHLDYKPRTAKRKLASLRAFLNHLEFEETLEINPIHKIKTKFQEPKELPKTIPLKSIEMLLISAHNEQSYATTAFGAFAALRDAAMLETLFATGMRVSELCSLKVNDVNLDDGTIRILGKGAKERVIQVGNTEVLNILRRYREKAICKSDFFLPIGCQQGYQSNPFAS